MNIEVKSGVYTHNGEDVSFNFSTNISAYDKVKFVNSVTDMLVGENYNYVIKNLAFDFCIVAVFSDVDTSSVTEAKDGITAMEEFLNETDIVDIIKANALPGVIGELETAVELNIEYRTGIHINPISSSLSSLLDTIEKKVDEVDLDSLMGAAEAMSGISGEFTPEKIIDAYAKTDIFKKNWENAEADKNTVDVIKGGKEAIESPLLSPTV